MSLPLVEAKQFIQAIRDAGYKDTPSAIAELVDNAFEAEANTVRISIYPDDSAIPESSEFIIDVLDDGYGMSRKTLHMALQFGGSARFNSRNGSGRFGMGLPSSSLSQARRLDVFSWPEESTVWSSYVDLDEVVTGKLKGIPKPRMAKRELQANGVCGTSGTLVRWSRCDKLSATRVSTLERNCRKTLGRLFRHRLWEGKEIYVNGRLVIPSDPMMLETSDDLPGSAERVGKDLEYRVALRTGRPGRPRESIVTVRFSQLPVSRWTRLTTKQKRMYGISKGAGVSILRSGREIDFGWYFMGSKRKENYDDWWRCEVHFEPELDELFGVSHTKQGIRPGAEIKTILSPDLEGIAHKLNAVVRKEFSLRKVENSDVANRLSAIDAVFPPAARRKVYFSKKSRQWPHATRAGIGGVKYKFMTELVATNEFFQAKMQGDELTITVNQDHSYYERFYGLLKDGPVVESDTVRYYLDTMMAAAARAETLMEKSSEAKIAGRYRVIWGAVLEAFLT